MGPTPETSSLLAGFDKMCTYMLTIGRDELTWNAMNGGSP